MSILTKCIIKSKEIANPTNCGYEGHLLLSGIGVKVMLYYFCSMGSQCKLFSKNINNDKYNICIDGYEKAFATYVYIKRPVGHSLIESFHQTLPYKMGYAARTALNKNITDLCENFSNNNRNYICIRFPISLNYF